MVKECSKAEQNVQIKPLPYQWNTTLHLWNKEIKMPLTCSKTTTSSPS